MELGTWYAILGVALVIIAFGERFIVYKVLVGQGGWLPEKAGLLANVVSGVTLLAGVILILVNFVSSRH
jgi:hypothetical protein